MTTMPSSTSPFATSSETMSDSGRVTFGLTASAILEALEQAMHVEAASHSEIGDRLRVEQCALKCFN